jgi:magnesium-transporting ATPase (P-type)
LEKLYQIFFTFFLNLSKPTSQSIEKFLLLLAGCHTVIPERKNNSEEVEYQASSPG